MPRFKLRIARFPYGGTESSECVDWLMQLVGKLVQDPQFDIDTRRVNDTPITMTRNQVFHEALADKVDYLLLVDSDMAPDCELGVDPAAKPFWETSWEFIRENPRTVVAAPYCGPPPHENVYVFTWDSKEGNHPNSDGQIVQYPRQQAAIMAGVQEAAALPTGLMLIDMRVFDKLEPPFTYYEFHGDGKVCDVCGEHKRGPQTHKASTEDVTFSRDLMFAKVRMFCNWDAWVGHVKRKIVRKPRPYTCDQTAGKLKEVIMADVRGDVQLIEVKPHERFAADIAKARAEHAARKAATLKVADGETLPFAEEIQDEATVRLPGPLPGAVPLPLPRRVPNRYGGFDIVASTAPCPPVLEGDGQLGRLVVGAGINEALTRQIGSFSPPDSPVSYGPVFPPPAAAPQPLTVEDLFLQK